MSDSQRAQIAHYWRRIQELEAALAASQAEVARLREALHKYRADFCEGFCEQVPADFMSKDMEDDCSGCRARAALALLDCRYKSSAPDGAAE